MEKWTKGVKTLSKYFFHYIYGSISLTYQMYGIWRVKIHSESHFSTEFTIKYPYFHFPLISLCKCKEEIWHKHWKIYLLTKHIFHEPNEHRFGILSSWGFQKCIIHACYIKALKKCRYVNSVWFPMLFLCWTTKI